MSESESQAEPAHIRWFRSVSEEIANEYSRLHNEALADPQRAGHGGEQTWARVLSDWLPSAYEVLTRRYIVPEIGSNTFETDIIVLSPSYPNPLRKREEVLFGGVAAAFSVKLTLDAAGIRDGVQRAVSIRRSMERRFGTARDEMTAPFPIGLLAHSHSWKGKNSTPRENITALLRALDDELAEHPRESLDYLCVADLGFWWTVRVPFIPTMPGTHLMPGTTVLPGLQGVAFSAVSETLPDGINIPVASQITHLLARLSFDNPMIKPLAKGFQAMGLLGQSSGNTRQWPLESVFSEIVRSQLVQQAFSQGSDFWGSAVF